MVETSKFYIGGQWVAPLEPRLIDVINPATEEVCAVLSMGSAADVDAAAKSAFAAFPAFSATTVAQRIALLQKIATAFERRFEDLAQAMTMDMGSPITFSRTAQAQSGLDHINTMIEVLKTYKFEEMHGTTLIVHEPIGVCGLITPWNWPINQIVCKVIPAIAAGCTMVLKPSEIAPLSALIFAEVLHEAGVPAGVFNLVNGDGPNVGAAISSHPLIDMVSFTGSTRAGAEVAKAAAPTVKRVAQELGGNSPNILLDDADLKTAVHFSVTFCFSNSGQSCNSPQRLLVPHKLMNTVKAMALEVGLSQKLGSPLNEATDLGPVASAAHFEKIQTNIKTGIAEGAELVMGGVGLPTGFNKGYFVRPTIFANVTPQMSIAQTEIFGPVIMLIGYETEEEAIAIANDTEFGLSAFVQGSLPRARKVAAKLRAGQVEINAPAPDYFAPFGGYKQSGNGREYGAFGLHDYLETKAIIGYGA